MSNTKQIITGFILIGLVIGAFILGTVFRSHIGRGRIPTEIVKKAVFDIFVTENDKADWALDKDSISFDNNAGILLTTYTNSDNKIVVSQQATPDPFNDIPNYYSILLSKLHEYAEISTRIGTVALTRPEELKGGQSAVINTNGTLLFAHPDKDLTEKQWKEFFSLLVRIK